MAIARALLAADSPRPLPTKEIHVMVLNSCACM
jgi:hypothetical protein